MKIRDFREHTITRSTPPHKNDYHDYKNVLCADFCGRCAYCNLHYNSITTPYEIDHFVPKKYFEGVRDDLLTDYNNMVFSCKKCNRAKSSQFMGDLTLPTPTNDLFYDPVSVDYNQIFYRDEHGAIASNDPKGKESIKRLKLYRPIHTLGWLCEELDKTIDQLENAIRAESNPEKKALLEAAMSKMEHQARRYNKLFIASYNDDSFSISKVAQTV